MVLPCLPPPHLSDRGLGVDLTLLSLSPDLQWPFEVKREIACADDNYTFIAEFARGLLLVFGSHSARYTSFHYVMSASEGALMKWGVHVSAGAKRDSKGSIVLAEVYVPRRRRRGCRGTTERSYGKREHFVIAKFEVAPGSSIDRANQLQIFTPRMQPTTEANGVEYQYPIYRGETMYGLGFFGAEALVRNGSQIEQAFILNLGHSSVIDSILQLKRDFEIQEDDAAFLVRLARGLVLVFATRTDNDEPVIYRAISDLSALQAHGLSLPENIQTLPSGGSCAR